MMTALYIQSVSNISSDLTYVELISVKFDFLYVTLPQLLNSEGTYVLLQFQSEALI